MHGALLIQDLAVVMTVAGLVTVLFHRYGQPVVLGYILAGLLIGPHAPVGALISDDVNIKTLADLGVVFLLFSLGLEFNLKRLARVGSAAAVAGGLEIMLMAWIGYTAGQMLGWSKISSLFLGGIMSISSTTIIVKSLHDVKGLDSRFKDLVLGILIIEDIVAITLIALLSGLATTGTLSVTTVAKTLGGLGVFLVSLLVTGLLIVPKLLRYVGKFERDDVLLTTVLGLCFGVSLLAVKLGYSVALGAFLIGAIVSESPVRLRIDMFIWPLREMFIAIFFVAVGMLIDPHVMMEYAGLIAALTAVVVVGNVAACSLGAFVAGNEVRMSLKVGMTMAQIGEFSFIIAHLGQSKGVTSPVLLPIAVSVSVLTTLLTPYLIRNSDLLVDWFNRAAPGALVDHLKLYSLWVARKRETKRSNNNNKIRVLVRTWAVQVMLNLALTTGIFLTAAYLVSHADVYLPWLKLPVWTGGASTVMWLSAMLLTLPLLIATLRKIRAAAMLFAELIVPRAAGREHTTTVRTVLVNVMLMVGTAVVGLGLLMLSAAILPRGRVLAVSVGVVFLVTALTWRSMVKIYAKAQIALRETLKEEVEPESHW